MPRSYRVSIHTIAASNAAAPNNRSLRAASSSRLGSRQMHRSGHSRLQRLLPTLPIQPPQAPFPPQTAPSVTFCSAAASINTYVRASLRCFPTLRYTAHDCAHRLLWSLRSLNAHATLPTHRARSLRSATLPLWSTLSRKLLRVSLRSATQPVLRGHRATVATQHLLASNLDALH